MPESRSKAKWLHDRLSLLETGLYAIFWNDLLQRVNASSQLLQNANLDLITAVDTIKSSKMIVLSKRESFTEYESKRVKLSGTNEYAQVVTRRRTRNVQLTPLDYDQTSETNLSDSEKFRVDNYLPITDQFVAELTKRLFI